MIEATWLTKHCWESQRLAKSALGQNTSSALEQNTLFNASYLIHAPKWYDQWASLARDPACLPNVDMGAKDSLLCAHPVTASTKKQHCCF